MKKLLIALAMSTLAFAEVAFLEKGTLLPLEIQTEGDAFTVEGEHDLKLKLQAGVYVKHEDDQMLFSADEQEWKPFEQYFTGFYGYALCYKDEGIVSAIIRSDFTKRD